MVIAAGLLSLLAQWFDGMGMFGEECSEIADSDHPWNGIEGFSEAFDKRDSP
jgi:hypothetical protein